jgi:hypothetical protein
LVLAVVPIPPQLLPLDPLLKLWLAPTLLREALLPLAGFPPMALMLQLPVDLSPHLAAPLLLRVVPPLLRVDRLLLSAAQLRLVVLRLLVVLLLLLLLLVKPRLPLELPHPYSQLRLPRVVQVLPPQEPPL